MLFFRSQKEHHGMSRFWKSNTILSFGVTQFNFVLREKNVFEQPVAAFFSIFK